MGSKSNAFENGALEHIFRNNFSLPGTIYVGLWTATLDDTSTGVTAGEVSGGAYARQSIAQGTAGWTAASGGSLSNSGTLGFPQATANWGTVTHYALLNNLTGGTILYWTALDSSKVVNNGDTASFAANAIVIAED